MDMTTTIYKKMSRRTLSLTVGQSIDKLSSNSLLVQRQQMWQLHTIEIETVWQNTLYNYQCTIHDTQECLI